MNNIRLCYQCGKCTAICPVRKVIRTSPRRNILDENIYHIKNEDVWSCLSCGLCSATCPQEVDYLEFIRSERKGKEYEVAHKGISIEIAELMSCLDSESSTVNSDYGFYPGCVDMHNLVFFDTKVDFKEIETASLKMLKYVGIHAHSIKLRCCGHDALWQGKQELFEKLKKQNIDIINKSGIKTLITSCAECYRTFSKDYDLSIDVVHITQVLKELEGITANDKVTLHDSCRLGRHMQEYDAPREILRRCGAELIEMRHNRENALCCGVSSMINCNERTKALRVLRLQEAKDTGADVLITTCPKCLAHLSCLRCEEDSPESPEVMDIVVYLARRM